MNRGGENGIETSRGVEEDEDTDFTEVYSDGEVIGDLDESGFCAMVCSAG